MGIHCIIFSTFLFVESWHNKTLGSGRKMEGDFPGGPVVKNLLSSARDTGLIPSWGTKIPHAIGERSLCATTRAPVCHNY